MIMSTQRLVPSNRIRHSHRSGYLAIVMSGEYHEIGDTGRWHVKEGDLIYHRAFEAHANNITAHCTVINIPTPFNLDLPSVFSISSTDELLYSLRTERKIHQELFAPEEVKKPIISNWSDQLALDIRKAPVKLIQWAEKYGVRKETVSRGFKDKYGVTPAKYRLLTQSRLALVDIVTSEKKLSDIAFDFGFSDQAHLSRAIKQLTNLTPLECRKSILFNT